MYRSWKCSYESQGSPTCRNMRSAELRKKISVWTFFFIFFKGTMGTPFRGLFQREAKMKPLMFPWLPDLDRYT